MNEDPLQLEAMRLNLVFVRTSERYISSYPQIYPDILRRLTLYAGIYFYKKIIFYNLRLDWNKLLK